MPSLAGRVRPARAVVVVGVLGSLCPSGPVLAECTVSINATGKYLLAVRPGRPAPVVDFLGITSVRFEGPVRSGEPDDCNKGVDASRAFTLVSDNATDLVHRLSLELAQPAADEAARSADPQPFRDLATLAAAATAERITLSLADGIQRATGAVMVRNEAATGPFTTAIAEWITENVTAPMVQRYVEGGEPRDLITGLAPGIVERIRLMPLAQPASDGELESDVFRRLDAIARDIPVVFAERFPAGQWLEVTSWDDCRYELRVTWALRGSRFAAVLTIRCDSPESSGLRLAVKATPVQPGALGTVTVEVFGPGPGPLRITEATIKGLAAVMPDGSPEPAAVIANRVATFSYVAARPRRDTDFPIVVQVKAEDGGVLLSGVRIGTVTVENVLPVLGNVVPAGASAEPGDLLELDGARLLVTDDNADDKNPDEVKVESLRIEHPAGLRTAPEFDDVDAKRRVVFQPATGRYVFEFSRSGRVAYPHPEGEFPARVTMADEIGEGDTFVNLKVLDAKPVVRPVLADPVFVHVGDPLKISVTARFQDKNGVEDMKDIVVDARKAGGRRYTIGDGLRITAEGKDFVEVAVITPFPHTDVEGRHDILAQVRDDAVVITGTAFINVGNEAPIITATGYRTGARTLALASDPPRAVCPGEPFTVGMSLSDPENDALEATVTILGTNVTTKLKLESDNTWIVELEAPLVPGRYTLRFEGKELPPGTKSVFKDHLLVVEDCSGTGRQARALPPPADPQPEQQVAVAAPADAVPAATPEVALATPVNSADVVDAPRDPAQALAAESPGGSVEGGQSKQEFELAEELRDALFSGPAEGPDMPAQRSEVEMYFLALGGSTGPIVQLFAVNRSGETVQLPADFLVLEPVRITPEAQARITTLLQGIVDAGATPQVLNAYCLEFLRQPPAAGTVLRMAGGSMKGRFAPAKRVLDAARRLRELGRLTPDSDPDEYFHAIRQWAIWTVEQRFDSGRFTDAFARTTRRNYESAGDKWSDEVERALRALAPNRWKDIQAVLREAGLP